LLETPVKSKVIETWFNNIAYSHSSSDNTIAIYSHWIEVFCNYVNKTPEQILEDFENAKRDRDFSRKYSQHLRNLIAVYVKKGYSSGSIKGLVSVVRSFFKYNDLPLGHIPMAKMHIVFHNRDITADEIREILRVSKPRERAFFSMMAQTGLRPDTLCHLKIKHIEPDFSNGVVPCKVEIPEELTKGAFGSYFTFMGDDATKQLRNYLNTRRNVGSNSYIFTAYGKTTPLHRKSISSLFARTLETLKESGLIEFKQKEEGKPRNVRLYNLRKFFRKYAGQAGIEYVNFWMGHKTDYQAPHIPASDVHYFSREDEEFQRELYGEKAMPHLRIETTTPTETDKTIRNLEQKIDNLEQENRELKKRLNGFTLNNKQVQELLHRIEKLEKITK
jgi:integrase